MDDLATSASLRTLTELIASLCTRNRCATAKVLFRLIDTNDTGRLSPTEFADFVQLVGSVEGPEQEVPQLCHEVLNVVRTFNVVATKAICEIFKALDKDGSGHVCMDEFAAGCLDDSMWANLSVMLNVCNLGTCNFGTT